VGRFLEFCIPDLAYSVGDGNYLLQAIGTDTCSGAAG